MFTTVRFTRPFRFDGSDVDGTIHNCLVVQASIPFAHPSRIDVTSITIAIQLSIHRNFLRAKVVQASLQPRIHHLVTIPRTPGCTLKTSITLKNALYSGPKSRATLFESKKRSWTNRCSVKHWQTERNPEKKQNACFRFVRMALLDQLFSVS